MSSTATERALLEIASTQGGYFTAKQAAVAGYVAPKRNYHVRVGNWTREHRGIFRLSHYPLSERADLMLWWLWSRNRADQPRGVFSHQTALAMHGLTDVMPSRIHITVPAAFRRNSETPAVLVLHRAGVAGDEVEQIDSVPVTNALRTILDVAQSGEVLIDDLRDAFEAAVKSGKITRGQIEVAGRETKDGTLQLLQGGRR